MLTYAGTSHLRAPIAVRERIAIPGEQLPESLGRLRDRFGHGAILATCNRLELYLVGEHPREAVLDFLAGEVPLERDRIERHFDVGYDRDAVHHLYAVAAGIESMVLGESEILGQVRTAFSHTVRAGADHALLSRLFHTAIRVGRRARTETEIGRHALSVSSIAVQQARALVPDLRSATVLVLGAGEAGRLAARSLVDQGVARMLVVNRTHARAERLAEELGGRAFPIEELDGALALADVVIGAADAPSPLISVEAVAGALARREGAGALLIDIGMPRDIDPAVRDLGGVTYLDLDDLQAIAARHAERRAGEVARVEAIIDEQAEEFLRWWEQLRVVPTIRALTDRGEAVRRAELARTLRELAGPDAPPELERRLDAMTRAIVKQLLHDPISQIRQRGDQEAYLHAARTLFQLDDTGDDASAAT